MRVQRLSQMTSNWDVYKTLSRWFMAILLVLILKKKTKKNRGNSDQNGPVALVAFEKRKASLKLLLVKGICMRGKQVVIQYFPITYGIWHDSELK